MSSSPVILILGAGPNIGQHVAQAFAAKGYKIALTSRKAKDESTGEQLNISSDLSDPNIQRSVCIFLLKCRKTPPRTLLMFSEAAGMTPNDPKDPLSLPLADFTSHMNINTTSAFVAAQEAVSAFKQLPDSASKTFIYTGNKLNTTTMAPLLDLGVGKSATAHIIQSAAAAYAERGFKFYYADERRADGDAVYSTIDGEAHGKHYLQLAEDKEQGPWQQTFVKGIGYKKFPVA
ncbi:MAG: hypothetical protein Q9221_001843 [Calogaya cf. arnoldii]